MSCRGTLAGEQTKISGNRFHASIANSRLQEGLRRPFWGEVYETVLAWYIAKPTTMALINPKKGKFNVTAKDGRQDEHWYDWQIATPYLVLAAVNLVGLGFAAWRFRHGPSDELGTVLVSSLWVIYNLLIIGGALAVSAEARQLRDSHRVATRAPATLRAPDGHLYPCTLVDYADESVGLELPGEQGPVTGMPVHLVLHRGAREYVFAAHVSRRDGRSLGLKLALSTQQQQIDFVQCTFARADAWLNWHHGEQRNDLLHNLFGVLRLGLRGYQRMATHHPLVLRKPLRRLGRVLHWAGSFLPRFPQGISP